VGEGTTETRLVLNEVRSFRGDGIRIEEQSTTVRRNLAEDNRGWGIFAVPGVNDRGGNEATGNGAGQCMNVAC